MSGVSDRFLLLGLKRHFVFDGLAVHLAVGRDSCVIAQVDQRYRCSTTRTVTASFLWFRSLISNDSSSQPPG